MIVFLFITVGCLCFVQSSEDGGSSEEIKLKLELEDAEIINKTIAMYGDPQYVKDLQLPGPEFLTSGFYAIKDQFGCSSGNYTLRTRTIIPYTCSYNGRYEIGTLQYINGVTLPVVKGQFGEHFIRKAGGYYIRTIGYISDENGYRQFLIDLTKLDIPQIGVRIGSVVMDTLLGGNPIG